MRSMIRAFGWAARVRAGAGASPAAAARPTRAADVARLQTEIERLKQELADQRQLILQLMQAEQQRYDVVLKMLRSGGGAGRGCSAAAAPAVAVGDVDVAEERVRAQATPARTAARRAARRRPSPGEVRSSGGQPIGEAYVYIDGLRSSARGHTVEVKQRDKQFAPRVLVVPLGTKLVFPNQDTVIHNVFSTAPGNSFDLGSVEGRRDVAARGAAEARPGRDLLQHPLEDARRRPGRSQQPLDACRRRRLVLAVRRPGRLRARSCSGARR